MPKMVMMVGAPGSGKSTWIKNFDPNGEYTVISSDSIIEEWAVQQETTYEALFQRAIAAASAEMRTRAQAAFKAGKNVIWDQTMMNEKSRKGPIQMCKANGQGYEMEAVVFSLTDQEHKRRLEARKLAGGKVVPTHIIESMLSRFEMPTKAEGFSKISVIRD